MLWTMNLRRGIRSKEEKPKEDTDDLNNKVVCISGTIPGYTRYRAQAAIKQKYPKVLWSDAMTKRVNVLLVGHGVGQTKLNLAAKYGIPIIEASKVINGTNPRRPLATPS